MFYLPKNIASPRQRNENRKYWIILQDGPQGRVSEGEDGPCKQNECDS